MKKLFTIAMIIVAVAVTAISCNKKNTDKIYVGLVTLVEGSWASGNFYVRYDNGKTAYVTNSGYFTFKPDSDLDREARALIYYVIEDQPTSGYDQAITITAMQGVPASPVYDIYDHKFEDPANYPDEIDVIDGYFAQDYISMQVQFKWSGSNSADHVVALVHNSKPDHEGEFQSLYEDDGYLHLEMYHNANNDTKVRDYQGYLSYKVKPETLRISLDDYVGIKLLYKSASGKLATYKMDFQTE